MTRLAEVRERDARVEAMYDPRNADRRYLLQQLDAALTTLRSIAANTCCDKCQEAALVARAHLAQLGEGKQ